MKRYKRTTEVRIEEAFKPQTEEERAEKVTNMIDRLVGETFGNKDQRSAMSSMISSIARESNRGNKDARKFLKELGNMCSNWGNGNFDPKDMPESSCDDEKEEEEEKLEEAPVETTHVIDIDIDEMKESIKQSLKKELLEELRNELPSTPQKITEEVKRDGDKLYHPPGVTEYKMKW